METGAITFLESILLGRNHLLNSCRNSASVKHHPSVFRMQKRWIRFATTDDSSTRNSLIDIISQRPGAWGYRLARRRPGSGLETRIDERKWRRFLICFSQLHMGKGANTFRRSKDKSSTRDCLVNITSGRPGAWSRHLA